MPPRQSACGGGAGRGAPAAQHRGLDPELGRHLQQRPAAALEQGHRLALELVREHPSCFRHPTPFCPVWSLAKVSTGSMEDQSRSRRPSRSRLPRPWRAWRSPDSAAPARPRPPPVSAPWPGPEAFAASCPSAASRAGPSTGRASCRTERDQVAHRPAGPKANGSLSWSGVRSRIQPWTLASLLGRQQPLAAPRRHPPPVQHPVLALRPVALQPDVHRLPLHADDLGRLCLAQSLPLDQPQCPPPQLLLRRSANAAKVPSIHDPEHSRLQIVCYTNGPRF